MDSKTLLQRTLRWAWTRDEVNQPSSWETLRYTVTMYVVGLGLIIATGVATSLFGYETFSFSLLLFGISFTTFIGIANIGWEWMRYRREVKEGESSTEPPEPERELAPAVQLDPEIQIGFIVTVVGILSLLVSYRVAMFIIENV